MNFTKKLVPIEKALEETIWVPVQPGVGQFLLLGCRHKTNSRTTVEILKSYLLNKIPGLFIVNFFSTANEKVPRQLCLPFYIFQVPSF
jgi:hypothetical protein